MKRSAFVALFAASALLPLPSLAQAPTNKPLRILVGFAPGGAPDILARILAKKLTENTGQPVIVENRAGASGNIAAQAVAAAEAASVATTTSFPFEARDSRAGDEALALLLAGCWTADLAEGGAAAEAETESVAVMGELATAAAAASFSFACKKRGARTMAANV